MVARPVTWLHPQVGSFSAGLAAFRAARLGVCLKELHGIAGFEASALRARALLRLGDVSSALEETGSEFDGSYRDRSEIAMLRGVALSRLGKAEESDHALLDARAYAISAGDRARETEAEYSLAFVAFGDGDLEGARSACRRGLNCSDTSTSEGGRLVVPLEHVAARLQELLGILAAADGRYREALVHTRATLHTLGACEFRDVWQEASAIANLAVLVRDLDDLQPTRVLLANSLRGFSGPTNSRQHNFVRSSHWLGGRCFAENMSRRYVFSGESPRLQRLYHNRSCWALAGRSMHRVSGIRRLQRRKLNTV